MMLKNDKNKCDKEVLYKLEFDNYTTQYNPTSEKIMAVKVGDFVKCTDNVWDSMHGNHLHIGDIVVVKSKYKHFIEVTRKPGDSTFMLSEIQFDIIKSDDIKSRATYESLKDHVIDTTNTIYCGDICRADNSVDINNFEEETSMSMANELNKMFGSIRPGMCRLSMSGNIAVKTTNGYKSYNMKSGRLVNCDNFALDPGTEWFFCIPTNHVKTGDIILINGKPCCVKKVDDENDQITVINYENNTVETVLPERHMFMGSMYFYSKVVSPFNSSSKKGGGMKKLMKYAMMSEMMKGFGSQNSGATGVTNSTSGSFGGMFGGNPMMAMAMFGGGNVFGDFFEGMFDDDDDGMGFMGGFFGEDDEEEEVPPVKQKVTKKNKKKPPVEDENETENEEG